MKNTIFGICLTALIAFIAYIWYVQDEHTVDGKVYSHAIGLNGETVGYTHTKAGIEIYLEKYTKLNRSFMEVKNASNKWYTNPGDELAELVVDYRNLYSDKTFIKLTHFPEYKYMYTLGLAMLSISDHYKWSYKKALERALNLDHQQRLDLIKDNVFGNVRYEDIKILEQ